MTTFSIKRSDQLALLALTITLLILLLLFWLKLPLLLIVFLQLVVILSGWCFFRNSIVRSSPVAITQLVYEGGHWHIRQRNDMRWSVQWMQGSVANGHYLALRWETDERATTRRKGYVLIWRDSMDEASYRALCRLLWHPPKCE